MLHRYVATRVLALDRGYDFSMVAPENFKGKSFMKLDMGLPASIQGYSTHTSSGEVKPFSETSDGPRVWCPVWKEQTNYYNPEFNFIEDNTIIDGEFQSIQYFGHRLGEIDDWLQTNRKWGENEDTCVIGFRGGEFYMFPELGLPKSYFEEGIEIMRKTNPKMKFEVETDDPKLAREFFPDFDVIHDIEENWCKMRDYRYAIIANSSFYILPRLLRHNHKYPFDYHGGENLAITIAPRFWARRNTKEWSRPDNHYKCFTYL